jgi:hypothetical protein
VILKLCIANSVALWMASDRDGVVADAIKAHTDHVETLLVYVVKPSVVPVSCQSTREFLDKWLIPGLAVKGVKVDEVIHGSCSAHACTCENEQIVCAGGAK